MVLALGSAWTIRAQDKDSPQEARRKAVSGRYFLQGVREVGAELQLALDGRFAYHIAYGGADGSAQGRWQEERGVIVLTTDPRPPAAFTLDEAGAQLDPSAMEEGGPPLVLLVNVRTKRLGMPWGGMQVQARFSKAWSARARPAGAAGSALLPGRSRPGRKPRR